jgi:hypothetical protein
MKPETQIKAARTGLVLSILGFVLSSLMLCDCPDGFLLAGIAALAPVFFGVRLVRITGVIFCILNFVVAVGEFKSEGQDKAKAKAVQERLRVIQERRGQTNNPPRTDVPP